LFDRLHDEEATRSSLLDRYRKGWSEANPDKILDVTAPGYRFRDPSLEAFRGGRCTRISISCRTDSPAPGQSRGGISAFSLAVRWTVRHGRVNFSSGAKRHGSGSPGSPGSKSENAA